MDCDSYRSFSQFLIPKDRELQKDNHVADVDHPEHVGSWCSIVKENPFVEGRTEVELKYDDCKQ